LRSWLASQVVYYQPVMVGVARFELATFSSQS
jgi:hypothetical protein